MDVGRGLAWAIILVQGAHVLEHVAQTSQVFVFGLPRPHAHGLLGAVLDLESVHFAYNTVFLLGLACFWRLGGSALHDESRGRVWSLFVAGVTLQGYHEVEHIVKMYQHLVFGQTPAPGILGNLVDLVVLHLAFNLIVFALVFPLLWRGTRSHVDARGSALRAEPARQIGGAA